MLRDTDGTVALVRKVWSGCEKPRDPQVMRFRSLVAARWYARAWGKPGRVATVHVIRDDEYGRRWYSDESHGYYFLCYAD